MSGQIATLYYLAGYMLGRAQWDTRFDGSKEVPSITTDRTDATLDRPAALRDVT